MLLQQENTANARKLYQNKLQTICNNIDTIEKRVIDGLAFNLTHLFDGGPYYWPRTISTSLTEGKQIPVYSSSEAILRFKESLFLDCRISAFKYLKSSQQYSSSTFTSSILQPSTQQQDICCVNFNIIDEDVSPSTSSSGLKSRQDLLNMDSVQQTISNICKTFHVRRSFNPTTILSTGNGIHYYTPMDTQNLSNRLLLLRRRHSINSRRKNELRKLSKDPAKDFLRFTEFFLSNGICDPVHNNTVSPNNCMMRLPGSINSKNLAQVRVLHSWNGSRKVQADLLYDNFIKYLKKQASAIKRDKQRDTLLILQRQRQRQEQNQDIINDDSAFGIFRRRKLEYQKQRLYDDAGIERIEWIDKLHATPLNDHRKYCIWRIFSRYFINVKHLSFNESYEKISEWLNRCAKLKRLNFNPDSRITEKLEYAIANENCFPISLDNSDRDTNLKLDNPKLYDIIKREIMMSG